ncbi:MAG: Lpg1974 family pore-forming outer membrane protein [Waddliaceae bacterium]
MYQKDRVSLFIIGAAVWFAPALSQLHAQEQQNLNQSFYSIDSLEANDSGSTGHPTTNNSFYRPSDTENLCYQHPPPDVPYYPNYPNDAEYAMNPYHYPGYEPQPCYGDPGYNSQPCYGEPHPYVDPACELQPPPVDYSMYPLEQGYAPEPSDPPCGNYPPYGDYQRHPYQYADSRRWDPSYCQEYPQQSPCAPPPCFREYPQQPPCKPSPYFSDCCYAQPMEPCSQRRRKACGLIIDAEGLYWTIFQTNLDYAVDAVDEDPSSNILGPGKTHFLDYDWRWGGRGYLGIQNCGWEVKGGYTWFESKASGKTIAKLPDMILKPSLIHPSVDREFAERAFGDQCLNYQIVDLLYGKNLYLCCNSLTLYPFFGARGLRLKQEMTVRYRGEDFFDETTKVNWHSLLKAAGLHAGLDYYFAYGSCGGFFGSFAGSVLVGRTDNHHLQLLLNEEEGIQETEINLKERQCIPIAGYHLSAGIFLATYDCCGDSLFRLKLGYELNEWFQTPQLRRYSGGEGEAVSNSATAGSIGLHGGFVSAELTF